MQALILTGGQGTRLRPLTLTTLKPLLPIANVSFLNYPLALLRAAHVKEAVMCTSDKMEPYRELIRAQKQLGTRVLCSPETKSLGTGGAVKNAERFVTESPFFAMNGDSLTDIDFSQMLRFHKSKKAKVTLALIPVEDASQFGLVLTDKNSRVQKFIEKPSDPDAASKGKTLINGGMYIMEKEVLDLIPKDSVYSLERELFPQLIKRGWPLFGFPAKASTYWLDIGTPEKYLKGNIDMILGEIRAKIPAGSARARLGNCAIHKTASIAKDVVIGKNCAVGENAVIKNSVLLDGVRIGRDCVIENCVLGNRCTIENNSHILKIKILGDGSRITAYSRL